MSSVQTVDDLLHLGYTSAGNNSGSRFAVYSYTPNKSDDSASDSLGGFSLNMVGCSVALGNEPLFRSQLALKLSRSPLYPGSGHITAMQIESFPSPLQCYYCLLALTPTHNKDTSPPLSPGSKVVATSNSFSALLVCLIHVGKDSLELFRTELDSFMADLKPLLEGNHTDQQRIHNRFPGSEAEARLKNWFSSNVLYLSRVVQRYHSELPTLLHVAMNSKFEVTGDNMEAIADIRRFLAVCSLATLMQNTPDTTRGDGTCGGTASASASASASDAVSSSSNGLGHAASQDQQQQQQDTTAAMAGDYNSSNSSSYCQETIKIHVTASTCHISPSKHNNFCSNWAQVLLSGGNASPDPFFLRNAVENYKLKIIQDINALKRLLRYAETSYHTLYRCYVFLCVCGNGDVLLSCAMEEARTNTSEFSSLSVLQALQLYVNRNGFREITA